MFGKRKRAKASAGDAVRQRLLRLEVSEMPAIERESAKSIYFALQRSPGGDPARIIVDTFLATLLVSESSDDTDVSASVRLFRSEFISNGRWWAESPRSNWNQLVDDMLQITKARATQSNDPQTRAVLCATYLFALIAYDPSKQAPTVEDVFELTKIDRVVRRRIEGAPHETLMVLDATVGQNAVRQVEAFSQAVDLTGIILSKMDSTARGGIVVALREEYGIPVKLIGTGEGLQDLESFDIDGFVDAVFG